MPIEHSEASVTSENSEVDARNAISAITVDVEDRFHEAALAERVRRDSQDRPESRAERNFDRLIEFCEEAKVACSFSCRAGSRKDIRRRFNVSSGLALIISIGARKFLNMAIKPIGGVL
ncbi:hypothetical protein [Lentisalinibacter sediminis]|uniref:hypothetical protein n=1 Tax=Lentisalinibacter sediminis TaxID=2992237 RepID=UPI00386CC263